MSGRLWGAVMATSELPSAFPAGTEERISSFAELVTAALANADAREQLAASRARIVEAADAARRRIERDLHDGAQQRLVTMALSLRRLDSTLEPDSAASRELTSYGPSSMPHSRSSVSSLAGSTRASSPIMVSSLRLRRWPRARRCRSSSTSTAAGSSPLTVQTTAYFVVAEALTNTAKHAGSERTEVRVAVGDEHATVEVRDDGSGGVDPTRGSGLSGLADRVSALGGTLEIDSPLGAGTTIRARIPVVAKRTTSRGLSSGFEYAHADPMVPRRGSAIFWPRVGRGPAVPA